MDNVATYMYIYVVHEGHFSPIELGSAQITRISSPFPKNQLRQVVEGRGNRNLEARRLDAYMYIPIDGWVEPKSIDMHCNKSIYRIYANQAICS